MHHWDDDADMQRVCMHHLDDDADKSISVMVGDGARDDASAKIHKPKMVVRLISKSPLSFFRFLTLASQESRLTAECM